MSSDGTGHDRALVLGAGGVVGTAWLIGLAAGLRRAGVDLAEADLILGTSAGAIVGAMLATDADLDAYAIDLPSDGRRPTTGNRLDEVFAVGREPGLDPAEKRRRIGRIALDTVTGPEHEHIEQMSGLVTAREWPKRDLRVTAVDTETGEPVVFDGREGAPLVSAVAASTAVPGVLPPVTIDGRRYMDGGMRSSANADLAARARVLVVVAPLAHRFPRAHLDQEIAAVGADAAVTIVPDEATLAVFGDDLHARSAWLPSYKAGFAQAAEVAPRVRDAWHHAT